MIGNLTASVNGYFTDSDAVDKRSKYRSMLEQIVKRIEADGAIAPEERQRFEELGTLIKEALRARLGRSTD